MTKCIYINILRKCCTYEKFIRVQHNSFSFIIQQRLFISRARFPCIRSMWPLKGRHRSTFAVGPRIKLARVNSGDYSCLHSSPDSIILP